MASTVQLRAALYSCCPGLAQRREQSRAALKSTSSAGPESTRRHLRSHNGFRGVVQQGSFRWNSQASTRKSLVRVAASSAASGSFGGEAEDPYQVLGLTPLDSFDRVKAAHRKKVREAEASGNEAELERIDQAYDKIMMQQLFRRQKGLTFGSVQVSQEVKFADDAGWFPWGPKYERSPKKTITLNAAVSVLMAVWAFAAQTTDWKVLQILLAYYIFTLFMKLEPFYPRKPEDDEKPWAPKGRRLVRSLSLAFGCVAAASMAHYVAYKGIALAGFYVPRALLVFQELLITVACSAGLFILGSYYR